MSKNNFTQIFRSGIIKKKGYYYNHNEKILSLYSASNVINRNNGAILQIDEYMNKNFIEFNAKPSEDEHFLSIDYFSNTFYYFNSFSQILYEKYAFEEIYEGIFSLRIKAKKEEYKTKIENKLKDKDMSDKNKILFRICCLPDYQFFNIVKFALL